MARLLVAYGDEGREYRVDRDLDYNIPVEEARGILRECNAGGTITDTTTGEALPAGSIPERWIQEAALHRTPNRELEGETLLFRAKVVFGR